MCRPLLVSLGLLLLVSLVSAQTQDQQKYKVAGTVVNGVTGEPLRSAIVQLNGPDHRSVMTGNDGRFEMDNVTGGQAFLAAQRPGFSPDEKQQQYISVGPELDSVVLKLNPLARISGQVLDSDGEPIDGMPVQCLRELIDQGRKRWQQMNVTGTDDTGHFLIEDIQPGVYVLRTMQKPLYLMASQKSEAVRYIYPATYYPNAASRDLAQQIGLAAGQEVKIDITLHSVRASRVSLTTVPPVQSVMASLAQGDEQAETNLARLNKVSGLLTLPAVAPGSWKLIVRGPFGIQDDGSQPMYGELPIEIASADIENLKLPLYKLPDLPVIQTGAPVNIRLAADNGPGAFIQTDDSKIANVQPGTYRVIAMPSGKGCIVSLTAGSQNLLREELLVAPGASPPPIQVTQSDNCPTLTVKVNSKNPAFVIVTNFQPGFEPQPMGVSNGNSASFSNLTPGSYSVFAFDNINDLEYANPEAMRNFKSQTVELEAGHEASVQVDLNERRAQ